MAPIQQERPSDGLEEAAEPTIEADTDDIGAQLAEAVREGADELGMTEFREPSAAAAHGHSPAKGEGTHDIRGAFNVTEEFIREHFDGGVVPNGHEGVHALLAGKQTFIEADEELFADTADDDPSRWAKIRSTADRAPIPPGRRSKLDARFAV